jgi:YesN/AraC family two-component response regulator
MVKPVDNYEESSWIQFHEIIEARYAENTPCCFYGGNVQAVYISERQPIPGKNIHLLKRLQDFLSKRNCHIFPYKKYTVILFADTPELSLRHLLENMSGYLERTSGNYAITLGSLQENQAGLGIRKTCREAEKLQGKMFFYKEKKYLSMDDLRKADSQCSGEFHLREEVLNICSYIQVIDKLKIRSFFQELENYFFYSGKSPHVIRQDCMELMMEMRCSLIKKIPAIKDIPGLGGETLYTISKRPYLKDIMNIMSETCLHICECLPLFSANSSFQNIISYVNNNYSEILKLETIGKLFNYNCAYLGKRFKDYTGMNFHTYIDILRINAAKQLLQDTNLKVYEISNLVGYSDTDYFYAKFKKFASESPMIFRKKSTNK